MPRRWLPSRRLCAETTTKVDDTERYEGCSHRVFKLPPNASRLSCGRNSPWRKAVERLVELVGEATEFFPT